MSEIGRIMTEIYPLITSYRELNASETTKIGEGIRQLEIEFEKAGPFIDKKSAAYQISYELVTDMVRDLNRTFTPDRIYTVRSRMRSIGEICSSCHTQDTKLRTLFSGIGRDKFFDDASYAEFNFITRNYEEAERFYKIFLLSKSEKTELELIQPIQRLILVYTQILSRPKLGAEKLRAFLELPQHTKRTKRYLEHMIDAMDAFEIPLSPNIESVTFKDLEASVDKIIGSRFSYAPVIYAEPRQELEVTWLRGLLFHYLNRNANEREIPKILFWLSVCDRIIGYNVYFSLTDEYLKACIVKFPANPFARACYDEYEKYVRFFETNPNKPDLSIESYRELERLRKMISLKNAK